MRQDIISNIKAGASDSDIGKIVQAHADSEAGSAPIPNLDEINKHFRIEGDVQNMFKNLEQSDSEFAKASLKKMSHMSPLSMGVVYEQIKRGQSMNLHDVFEMEYKIS